MSTLLSACLVAVNIHHRFCFACCVGGEDSLLNVWVDCTAEEQQKQQDQAKQRVLKEQSLNNALKRKQFDKVCVFVALNRAVIAVVCSLLLHFETRFCHCHP